MNSNEQFELQNQIRENSSGIQKKIIELQKWEKEIKRTPADCQTKKNENSYPIRSHKENTNSNGFSKSPNCQKKENESSISTQSQAIVHKESGNESVKNEDYEGAAKHYTEAIKLYDSDPVFYTNRALCFLKLERYTECIDDCSKAIQLNPQLTKAYYRRMQANEVLCEYTVALSDCKEILKLDPKNTEALQANLRLANRIAGKDLSGQSISNIKHQFVTWSKLDASVKDINFIGKPPPHLQSKVVIDIKLTGDTLLIRQFRSLAFGMPLHYQCVAVLNAHKDLCFFAICEYFKQSLIDDKPLRRIQINQPPLPNNNNCATSGKKSKDEENEAFKSSADVNLDQSNQLSNGLAAKMNEKLPLKSPLSSAEFYRTWRELVENNQKYGYLKIIDVDNFNKLLGPQFNSEMFSELLQILSEFFIRDNVPVAGILKQIVANDEFKILNMFMDTNDKKAFDKLLNYIETNEQKLDDLALIKQKQFNSM